MKRLATGFSLLALALALQRKAILEAGLLFHS
jgi:hypothetical protein